MKWKYTYTYIVSSCKYYLLNFSLSFGVGVWGRTILYIFSLQVSDNTFLKKLTGYKHIWGGGVYDCLIYDSWINSATKIFLFISTYICKYKRMLKSSNNRVFIQNSFCELQPIWINSWGLRPFFIEEYEHAKTQIKNAFWWSFFTFNVIIMCAAVRYPVRFF